MSDRGAIFIADHRLPRSFATYSFSFIRIGRFEPANVSHPGRVFDTNLPLRVFKKGAIAAAQEPAAIRFQVRSPKCLPAIAAVAAISAAPATAAMAASPTSATAMATPSAAVPTAPAATSAALCLGTCFIYHEVSSAEILTVQGVHCAIRIFVISHFYEGEPARLSRKPVANQIDARGSHTDLLAENGRLPI